MSAQTRKHKIHGIEVEQVSYQGKWYTGVAARVQIAEQADPDTIRQDGHGYHVMSVAIIQLGDKWAYHCMVEYPVGSGVVRPGTDFIDLADKAGIAKAETSAIGRALGLHGIAIEEGIASAEEMRRSGVAPDDAPTQPAFVARPPVIRAPADEPAAKEARKFATPDQWTRLRKACELLAIEPPEAPLEYERAENLLHEYMETWKRLSAQRQRERVTR